MATNESAFPLEIFDRIIEIIGSWQNTTTPGSKLLQSIHKQEWLTTLRACSLVSRAFAHYTRPYIFQYANVGFNEDTASERRLHRLMDTLNTQPEFVRYIRHLDFDFNNTYPGPLMSHCSPQKLSQCTDFLLKIPNLRSLSLSYSYSYVTYDPDDYLSMPEVTNFCEDIIEAYAGSKLSILHSLHAKKISILPFPTIFGCESLNTLSLDRCQWPVMQAPIPQLIALRLRKIVAPIPVISLLYLPSLKDLVLESSYFDVVTEFQPWNAGLKGSESPLLPPFRLSNIAIHTSVDQFRHLATFLQHFGEKHSIQPLNCVSSLSISLERLTAHALPNFGMMPSLQYLSLAGMSKHRILLVHLKLTALPSHCCFQQVDSSSDDQEPLLGLLNLKLAENISTGGTLTSLVSLDLRIRTQPKLNPYYLPMVTSLADFLLSVTPDCNLRHLTISVKAPFNSSDGDRDPRYIMDSSQEDGTIIKSRSPESNTSVDYETSFWSSLSSFAGSCMDLPKFETLALEVTYIHRQSVPTDPRYYQFPEGQSYEHGDFSVETTLPMKEWEDRVIIKHIYDLQRAFVGRLKSTGVQFLARVDHCEQPVSSVRRATIVLKNSR